MTAFSPYCYEASVLDIYDGDTMTVFVDLGFGTHVKQTLRLRGIDAPEVKGPSRKAGVAARDWLRQKIPLGSSIKIVTHKDRKEKFGRYLADVIVGSECINETLVKLNLAKYRSYT